MKRKIINTLKILFCILKILFCLVLIVIYILWLPIGLIFTHFWYEYALPVKADTDMTYMYESIPWLRPMEGSAEILSISVKIASMPLEYRFSVEVYADGLSRNDISEIVNSGDYTVLSPNVLRPKIFEVEWRTDNNEWSELAYWLRDNGQYIPPILYALVMIVIPGAVIVLIVALIIASCGFKLRRIKK